MLSRCLVRPMTCLSRPLHPTRIARLPPLVLSTLPIRTKTTKISTPALKQNLESQHKPTEEQVLTNFEAPYTKYHLVPEGEDINYRLYFKVAEYAHGYMSSWHDIPLRVKGGCVSYVNEIPKGSRAKMEVATKERFNPIRQDVKKGQLRFFTYGDIPFNYGCLPQTWEDPHYIDPNTKCKGDNDPLDIVELSGESIPTGYVVPVKILGCLAMIDEGETDWKILAIQQNSPLFDKLNTVADVDTHCPGLVDSIRDWFRMYKTTDGKSENKFAFDGQVQSRDFALSIINECNIHWKQLLNGRIDRDSLWLPENPYQTSSLKPKTKNESTSNNETKSISSETKSNEQSPT